MRDKLRQLDETFLDLVFGILFFGVVSGILGMIITKGNLWYLLGIIVGTIAAIGIITHMTVSIKRAVEMDTQQASKYMIRCTIVRYVIMLLILAPGIKLDFVCFIGILIGFFGSKVSALFHGFVHQHITKRILHS